MHQSGEIANCILRRVVSAVVMSVQQSHFTVFSPHYLYNTFMIIRPQNSGSVGSSSWKDVCSTQEETLKDVALNLPSTRRQVFFQMSSSTSGNVQLNFTMTLKSFLQIKIPSLN